MEVSPGTQCAITNSGTSEIIKDYIKQTKPAAVNITSTILDCMNRENFGALCKTSALISEKSVISGSQLITTLSSFTSIKTDLDNAIAYCNKYANGSAHRLILPLMTIFSIVVIALLAVI